MKEEDSSTDVEEATEETESDKSAETIVLKFGEEGDYRKSMKLKNDGDGKEFIAYYKLERMSI